MSNGLKGLAFVVLRMNDFNGTIEFYEKLGLKKNFGDEGMGFLSFGFPVEGYTDILCSRDVAAPPPGETGIRIKLAEGTDFKEWVKQKQSEGVQFMTFDIVETDWVYEIKIKDPAGNILTIFR